MRGNFYYKRLGGNIRKYRKKRDLSQEQLALLSGTDRSYLNEVELGKANPTIKFLHRVTKVLKIKLNNLIKSL
ncbi:MAG: DNA-binding helix-turn-helix protein [Candidatus Roizmanbacteria bacterium GW2011_GWA2_35_19]|uniref:DNA-binding helix-turn-helix protein n=2 Tax=Candidatus Roizmaniibacteriota TaxID=1752723 RepID=A0A0G0E5K4_9BACT|nr:MAG: DNA-binding helix-turn-helix protein [Candidatus Roizmanbacteria bacterium GW2011_GWC2_35_12]KKP70615.1 MAG: DNA-binding helix-turn-helix protein [Candidatus Roizmanbacteria bacterium GW2011_GWA2_35_19]